MARQNVSKDAYLRILNATLTRHPDYMAGMAFHNIIPDGPHTYEVILPASVSDRRRAEQVFDAVAHEVRRHYVCTRARRIEEDQEPETTANA